MERLIAVVFGVLLALTLVDLVLVHLGVVVLMVLALGLLGRHFRRHGV